MRTALVLVTMMGLSLMAHAPPASAANELELLHVPQPIALAGHELVLPVAVRTSCGMFCSPIEVSVTYEGAAGRRTVRTWVSQPMRPVVLATLSVPGAEVQEGVLRYALSAQQTRCWPFGKPCHTSHSRVPAAGTYSVPVAGSPGSASP